MRTLLLFCLTSNDQTNIIASLVGRSLGFHKASKKRWDGRGRTARHHECQTWGNGQKIF